MVYIAWGVAFWFWRSNIGQDPRVIMGQFGAATAKVNGYLECTTINPAVLNSEQAKRRFQVYTVVLAAFDLSEVPVETGCYS
jgi:hypothetical protein